MINCKLKNMHFIEKVKCTCGECLIFFPIDDGSDAVDEANDIVNKSVVRHTDFVHINRRLIMN